MTLKPISISFDQNYSNKIRIIQEAISDPTSHQEIVEGLVDTGYANALRNLYMEGQISPETYRIGISNLPKQLHSCFDS